MAMPKATKKLTVLCTSMVKWEENEEGEKVKKVYTTGDTILVTAKQRETYLAMETGGRPLFEDYDADDEDDDDEKEPVKTGTSTPSTVTSSTK